MNDFPEFMKNPVNKVVSNAQYTKGIEGYVFDGVDGSQMAFWTNAEGGKSTVHTHTYDEYVVVVQGQYTVIVGEIEFPLQSRLWRSREASRARVAAFVGCWMFDVGYSMFYPA